jgi:LmbE family N-acetylglucosaminyl deacetylase
MEVMDMTSDRRRKTKQRDAAEYLTMLYANPNLRKGLIQDPEVNSNSRVLILAPHHLDELIGCGGTMCKLAKRGAHVKVVYLTDSSYNSIVGPGCTLVPMDRSKAEESLTRLGCFESEILDLPPLAMHCDKNTVCTLSKIIDYYSPDFIFIPTLKERHPDNVMTGLLAARALKEYTGRLTLYSYEVWGGLFPNTMVEITEVMPDKIAAIGIRRSKSLLIDEEKRLREANSFRLTAMQEERYCEPFMCQEKEDFVNSTRLRIAVKAR